MKDEGTGGIGAAELIDPTHLEAQPETEKFKFEQGLIVEVTIVVGYITGQPDQMTGAPLQPRLETGSSRNPPAVGEAGFYSRMPVKVLQETV